MCLEYLRILLIFSYFCKHLLIYKLQMTKKLHNAWINHKKALPLPSYIQNSKTSKRST